MSMSDARDEHVLSHAARLALEGEVRPLEAELEQITARLAALSDDIGLDGAGHDGTPATVEALMRASIRLYATMVAREGDGFIASGDGLSTTETVTVISALMQAQNLNTFDLALWQSTLRRG